MLACITDASSRRPTEVYDALTQAGVRFIQFIPVVERAPAGPDRALGLRLAPPPEMDGSPGAGPASVTAWSVRPRWYAHFMSGVFEQWVRRDVGRVFVMNFEWLLAGWMGQPSVACTFAPACGRCLILDHDGTLYACDHFAYTNYVLGDITTDGLARAVTSPNAQAFARWKSGALAETCRRCEFLPLCWGGCPKHRFVTLPDEARPVSYLCEGYRSFFRFAAPHLDAMAQLIDTGLPASDVMVRARHA